MTEFPSDEYVREPAQPASQMTFSNPCDELFAALAKAQATITSPPRNREVEVKGQTKSGKEYRYTFKYATLDCIIDHVRGSLSENGLWFIQSLAQQDGRYKLVTHLVHASGQYVRSETPLMVDGTGSQAFGSALTYMRRYSLTALLGVASDEDDDGNGADGNDIEKVRDRSQQRPNPKKTEPAESPADFIEAKLREAAEVGSMDDVAKIWHAQQPAIKRLSDDQMARLEAVKDELKASASNGLINTRSAAE